MLSFLSRFPLFRHLSCYCPHFRGYFVAITVAVAVWQVTAVESVAQQRLTHCRMPVNAELL